MKYRLGLAILSILGSSYTFFHDGQLSQCDCFFGYRYTKWVENDSVFSITHGYHQYKCIPLIGCDSHANLDDLCTYKCVIFNRWGDTMFYSTNPHEKWLIDGEVCPDTLRSGYYFSIIYKEDSTGKLDTLTNTFEVLNHCP